MKKIISYFIKYPVAVNIIIIAFVVLGYMGYSSLSSSYFPLADADSISISINYPGASPQEIEEGVVLLIENNLKGTLGVGRVTSKSSENSAQISVETLKGYDIDAVVSDVKNAVNRIPNFPADIESVVVSKMERLEEAIEFSIIGENVSFKALKDYARQIEADLLREKGISQVKISGVPDEEIEIAVRENDLRAYNITFQDISNAVSKTSLITTGGTIKTTAEEYLIRANNRKHNANELENLVLKVNDNGFIVRLKDVANIKNQFNESPNANYYNGKKSVNLSVKSTNSENLIYNATVVRNYIKTFNEKNKNIQLHIINDRSIALEQRTQLLLENALVGMLLVFVFLALFLKPRLALWVAAGLPVAFLGMFAFVGIFGVTINVLSLFGMIIVIGILVDDGIVIAENIYSEFEKGKLPIRAAIDGTMQVMPSILAAIATTILAFSIFFFLDGTIGNYFGEVATIVTLTLLISLVEALIILPSHIAHSKALNKDQKVFGFNKTAEKAMNYMRDKLYAPAIGFFMESIFTKILGLVIPIIVLVVTIGGITGGVIGFTFFPTTSSDSISISITMPEGTNEKLTEELTNRIEKSAWYANDYFDDKQSGDEPIVQNVIKTIGPGSAKANITVNLLPGELRDFSADEVTKILQENVGEIHDAESVIFGSGTVIGGKAVSVALLSNNIDELKQAKIILKEYLVRNPKIKDVSDTDPAGIKEVKVILKENAYNLGLTLSDVMGQVRSGFFGQEIQRSQRGQDEVKVWVRYAKNERTSIKNLENMQIVTPKNSRVAFSEIASFTIERGAVAINHLDGLREIRVEADMKDPKESATEILADLKKVVIADIQEKFPSLTVSYEGQNRETEKIGDSTSAVLPIFLLLIYIVIVFTFRSYSQPLILLTIVPFGFIGVAWGHYIHGFSVNVLSILGIIALIGIMVNDGLVLITKLNENLKSGMLYKDAVIEAGKSRFRAIFLTSLTTIAGLAPLILETSRQAQFLIPMAISIAYGIAVATVLTLIMLPVLLSFTNATKVNLKWLWTGKKPTHEEVERAVIELESENEDLH